MMLASLTGSSFLKNRNDVFSFAPPLPPTKDARHTSCYKLFQMHLHLYENMSNGEIIYLLALLSYLIFFPKMCGFF